MLGAGLLAVSYAAQRQYLFGARHENWPSVIEALSLDLAMLIFAMLALGLAKKGLPARTERAAVVACAAGSAFMNYLAADISSPRSVAAYVMPPILLALAADRVIAVVRRWVLGQQATEASVWRSIGRAVAVSGLYGLRFAMAPSRLRRASGGSSWLRLRSPRCGLPIEAPEIEARDDRRAQATIDVRPSIAARARVRPRKTCFCGSTAITSPTGTASWPARRPRSWPRVRDCKPVLHAVTYMRSWPRSSTEASA